MLKSVVAIVVVVAFVVLAGMVASWALSRRQSGREQMRARALPVTMRQAQPIIGAIERYRREKGALPRTLSVLVPGYLRQIPDAGLVAEGSWRYATGTQWQSGGWSLSVRVRDEFSPNLVGFGDTFVFHPSGQYPPAAYGGGLRPFGGWGYYVE